MGFLMVGDEVTECCVVVGKGAQEFHTNLNTCTLGLYTHCVIRGQLYVTVLKLYIS